MTNKNVNPVENLKRRILKTNSLLFVWLVLQFCCLVPIVAQEMLETADGKQNPCSISLSKSDQAEIVHSLAQALRENYVFPDVGEKIAALIEENQRTGQYANIVKPEKLASVLTRDLRSINNDKHLNVWVVPEKTSTQTNESRVDYTLTHGKPANYGFNEARILEGNIGYIKMTNFSMDEMYEDAVDAATTAMKVVEDSDALIIDLRDNPGGGARLFRYLASYLFDKTPVHLLDYYFRTTDRTLEYWTLEDIPGKRLPEMDVYILINTKSFSASEIFAYSLKHLGRATVVGETSIGGAHGGSERLLVHNFATYIPHSRMIHPVTKTDYEGVGVVPDIKVESAAALLTAHVAAIEKLGKESSGHKAKEYAPILSDLKQKLDKVRPSTGNRLKNQVAGLGQNVSPDIEKNIDQIFVDYSGSNSPGVAVAVLQKGELVFKKAYGNANLEHQVPIDPDTSVFNAGSVSKQVTAFAILLLAEQGKLSLDDDIHRYIPELNEYGVKVSLRQLAHHTGGIRSDLSLLAMAGWSPGDRIAQRDVLQMIYRQRELNFKPGEECDYSNAGYDLIAEVVARASGQSFAEFCKTTIFQPLEMNNTFFVSDRFNLIPNLALPYDANQSETWSLYPNDSYSGSTGLFTTAADFSKWALNFRNPKVGSNETLKLMDTMGVLNNGKTCGYSFGFFTEEYRGLKHIQHGGATSGYRSYIGRFPDQDFTIVMFGNSSSIDPRRKSLDLADIFLRQHFKDALEKTSSDVENLPVDKLEKFVGNYWDNQDRSVRIHTDDGRLSFSIGGGPSIELQSIGEAEFEMLGIGVRSQVHFRKSGDGTYSMHVVSDGVEDETYQPYVPVEYSSDELSQFVGSYYSPELDAKYLVGIEGGSLSVEHLRFPANTLSPVVQDIFSNTGWRFTTLSFERDAENKVSGLRISSMRSRNIHFRKLAIDLVPSGRKSLARSILNVVHEAGIEKALTHFEEMKNSGEYYINESEMNNTGYTLLGQERVDAAIMVFSSNVSLFPNSWNAFDSLGEAYAKKGATKLAIENYSRSVQLNPENTNGILILEKLGKQDANDSANDGKNEPK